MNKLFLPLFFLASSAFAALTPGFIWYGGAVSDLPGTCLIAEGQVSVIIDGDGVDDCTSGGQNDVVVCVCVNDVWTPISGMVGPGTVDYVSKFITETTIGDSVIYENSATDAVSFHDTYSTSPSTKTHIIGPLNIHDGTAAGGLISAIWFDDRNLTGGGSARWKMGVSDDQVGRFQIGEDAGSPTVMIERADGAGLGQAEALYIDDQGNVGFHQDAMTTGKIAGTPPVSSFHKFYIDGVMQFKQFEAAVTGIPLCDSFGMAFWNADDESLDVCVGSGWVPLTSGTKAGSTTDGGGATDLEAGAIAATTDFSDGLCTDDQILENQAGGWACTATPVDTDTNLSQEQVEDYAGGLVTGNTETGIDVTYQTADNTLDFVVSLGTAIDTSEITDGTISEIDLKVVDSPADEECFTYEATTGDFEWQVCGSASQEEVEDYAGALIENATGTHTGISITYQDATGDVDFDVDHDAATNFLTAEHVDWAGASAGTIHATNYVDADTYVTGKDAHDHVGGDGAQIDHDNLANVSTSDHHVQTVDEFCTDDACTVGADDSVTGATITLADGTPPTADGVIEFDSTLERIQVGDDGVATLDFYPGAHTSDTNAGTICASGELLNGDGTCDAITPHLAANSPGYIPRVDGVGADYEDSQMYSDATGVAWGHEAPSEEIHIKAASYPTAMLEGTTTAGGQLVLKSSTGQWSIYSTGTDLRFYSGADRVTMQSDGDVGIKTSSPNTGLDVADRIEATFIATDSWDTAGLAGDQTVLGVSGGVGYLYSYDYTGSAFNNLYLNAALYIEAGNEIGIGISTPTDDLHIYRTGADAHQKIQSATDDAYLVLDGHTAENSSLYFYENAVAEWVLYKSTATDFVLYDYSGAGTVLTWEDGASGDLTLNPGGIMSVTALLKLWNTDTPGTCNAANEGALYYDASNNVPCYCDASSWLKLTDGAAC